MDKAAIERAKEHFGKLLETQMKRMERMKSQPDWIDYSKLKPVKIGILAGDGIGPIIAEDSKRVLESVLADEVKSGKVEIRDIEGLTIENRAACNKPIPDDVLAEIKKYHVTLKGPTTTPRKGDPWPNIESCNVAIRKELDLFANVRPVRIPKQGINWIFFRENTEDMYALGSDGIEVDENIAIDFRLISAPGADRICRLAFEHAKKNGRTRVTCVTKANVVKTTDGRFLENFYRIANIGKQYAMFEAIHGSAPRMVKEGRAPYADPASMIRAASMLLSHIGYAEKGKNLEMALDICGQYEKKLVVTGRP